jgi:hypothetical protein
MRVGVWLMATAVAACAAAAPEERAAPPSVPPSGMCRPFPAAELPPAQALEAHGAIGARLIHATPGQLACSEAALGNVDCFARAGRTLVRLERNGQVEGFDLRGQEALRISEDNVVCVPPTDGPATIINHEPAPDVNDVHAAIASEAQRLYGAECDEVRVPERAIEAVELTGGGHAEFAVFFARVQCSADGGPTTRWHGTGGAMVQFWLASGGPPRLLLEHSMFGFSPADDFPGLITHQHGGYCPDGAGPNICEVVYRWNDRDRTLEVIRRTSLEEGAEIDRRSADLRFDHEAVSRR